MNAVNPIVSLKAPPTIRGFALSQPITGSGNYTLSAGEQSLLRKQIEDFDALPDASSLASSLASRIEGEERKSTTINIKDIRVGDDMSIKFGDVGHSVTQDAYKALLRGIAPKGAYSYLTGVDVDLRAYNTRALLQQDERIKVRTKNGEEGERVIFGVVPEAYPDVYANDVLRTISRQTATDAKGTYVYDPNTTQLSFRELLRQEVNPSSYKWSKDDTFQVGRGWSLRDDGSTSIAMNLLMYRQICSNMQMLAADSYLKRVRHRGQESSVIARVGELFKQTGGFVEHFSTAWSSARSTRWNDDTSFDKAVAAYGYLINSRKVSAIGDKDLFAMSLATAWLEEPGDTIADLVNGVTRYARTGAVSNSSRFALDKLELQASDLMTLPANTWEHTRKV
jgi:hypothetical protein